MLGNYVFELGLLRCLLPESAQGKTLIKNDFERLFEKHDVLHFASRTLAGVSGGREINPLEMYLNDLFTVPVNIAERNSYFAAVRRYKGRLPVSVRDHCQGV